MSIRTAVVRGLTVSVLKTGLKAGLKVGLAAGLAAGLALGSTGAVQASTLTHHDARGDVRAYTNGSGATVRAPHVKNGDVLRVHILHGSHSVRVRIKIARMTMHHSTYADFLRIRTSKHQGRIVRLDAWRGHWRGRAHMYTPGGKRVRCGVQHRINWTTNILRIAFPRTCLHNPRWVRIGVGAVRYPTDDLDQVYVDDGFADNAVDPTTVALSRRLRHG